MISQSNRLKSPFIFEKLCGWSSEVSAFRQDFLAGNATLNLEILHGKLVKVYIPNGDRKEDDHEHD
jgi:hypothetical protein